MIGRDTVCHNGCTVIFGGIALVLCPVVVRKLLGNLLHKFVTVSFGEDARSGDAHHLAVAFHDCGIRDVIIWIETVAVNEDVLGPN